jgi:hypothetical protein
VTDRAEQPERHPGADEEPEVVGGGDLSYDSIDYNSIFAIGLMLFIMTLGLNVLSRRFVNRFREVYE